MKKFSEYSDSEALPYLYRPRSSKGYTYAKTKQGIVAMDSTYKMFFQIGVIAGCIFLPLLTVGLVWATVQQMRKGNTGALEVLGVGLAILVLSIVLTLFQLPAFFYLRKQGR